MSFRASCVRWKGHWVGCHYQDEYLEFSLRHQNLKGYFGLEINKDMVSINTILNCLTRHGYIYEGEAMLNIMVIFVEVVIMSDIVIFDVSYVLIFEMKNENVKDSYFLRLMASKMIIFGMQ